MKAKCDQQTDQQTDQPTDRAGDRVACMPLKTIIDVLSLYT